MAKKMFKNLSLTQKTILYLKEKGWEEIVSKNKYRMFQNPDTTTFYFVGRAGAVRASKRKAAKGSVSITHNVKLLVKKWADKQDQKELVELP